MNDKRNKNKSTTISNKELFEYILGSFEYVLSYTENYTDKTFEQSLLIQDAVSHRMFCIGSAAKELSRKLRKKHHDFPWFLYVMFKFDNDAEMIWRLVSKKSSDDFGSINSLFLELEKLYFKEFYPNKTNTIIPITKAKAKIKEKIIYTYDYKYPIKTSKSIWTVRKR